MAETSKGIKPKVESKTRKKVVRKAAIKETTLTDIIKNALGDISDFQDLYDVDKPNNASSDNIATLANNINLYWKCVKDTWSVTWEKSSTEQLLTHKAGLLAMTSMMKHILKNINLKSSDAEEQIKANLELIKYIPWEDKELRTYIPTGRSTDAKRLGNAIFELYKANKNPDPARGAPKALVVRDAQDKEHRINLLGIVDTESTTVTIDNEG